MKFNKYIKDGKTINATEKTFNIIYKSRGFREFTGKSEDKEIIEEVKESEGTEQSISEVKADTNVLGYDDMTKADITKLLGDKGMEHNPRDTKQKLYDLLLGGD